MAVETRFVIVRNNKEVKVFMDKKSADEHDKMLDIADSLELILSNGPIVLSDADKESLSIYLAKEKEKLLIALQAKKAKPLKKEATLHSIESNIKEGTDLEKIV